MKLSKNRTVELVRALAATCISLVATFVMLHFVHPSRLYASARFGSVLLFVLAVVFVVTFLIPFRRMSWYVRFFAVASAAYFLIAIPFHVMNSERIKTGFLFAAVTSSLLSIACCVVLWVQLGFGRNQKKALS